MGEWREMRWLRLHAMIAPFGVFLVTVLLLARSGKWSGWESLESAATLVDLGAVIYAMVAVLVERGVDMVFWALEQRRKRLEEQRQEARAELITEMLAAGVSDETRKELEQWAREKGIPLNKHPRK